VSVRVVAALRALASIVCGGVCEQTLCEVHDFDLITRWTLSSDGQVFAFSREDNIVVYLVSAKVGCPCWLCCCARRS
jgi:hypothetical protein